MSLAFLTLGVMWVAYPSCIINIWCTADSN